MLQFASALVRSTCLTQDVCSTNWLNICWKKGAVLQVILVFINWQSVATDVRVSKRSTVTLASQAQTAPWGFSLSGHFDSTTCKVKPAEYMLIKRCYVAGHPSFYWLKACADSSTHVKKAHRYVNAVNVEICAGIELVNLFDPKPLQCKLFNWMLIKSAIHMST